MAVRAPRASRPASRSVFYPESDGKPLGESDDHVRAIFDALYKLDTHFGDQPDVYVASNNLLYHEEGNPRRFVVPDVYVVRGVPKVRRRVYKLWVEGLPPSFVLEVTSRGTRRIDLGSKQELYARLGVAEYFIFDPLGEYLRPPLTGFHLVGGVYLPIAAGSDGALRSEALRLRLRAGDGVVEVADPASGRVYLSPQAERLAREAERSAREAAEAEIVRLRAELVRREGVNGP